MSQCFGQVSFMTNFPESRLVGRWYCTCFLALDGGKSIRPSPSGLSQSSPLWLQIANPVPEQPNRKSLSSQRLRGPKDLAGYIPLTAADTSLACSYPDAVLPYLASLSRRTAIFQP